MVQVGLQTIVVMRYRVPISAVAAAVSVSIVVEQAAAIAQAGGAGGANWYLRAPDGSSQGPYGLSQLGEWSSSGYVSLGENLVWVQIMQHDQIECLNPPLPAGMPTCTCVSNPTNRLVGGVAQQVGGLS